MFYVIHAALGAIIGLHFHSVWLVIICAFLSHFLLDILPHWSLGFDKGYFKAYSKARLTRKMVFLGFIDAILAVSLIYLANLRFDSNLLILGSLAALFPDMMSAGYFTRIKKRKSYNKFLHFHNNIQREVGFLIGCFTQIVILIVFLFILF